MRAETTQRYSVVSVSAGELWNTNTCTSLVLFGASLITVDEIVLNNMVTTSVTHFLKLRQCFFHESSRQPSVVK